VATQASSYRVCQAACEQALPHRSVCNITPDETLQGGAPVMMAWLATMAARMATQNTSQKQPLLLGMLE
jgi:hypothetical protein